MKHCSRNIISFVIIFAVDTIVHPQQPGLKWPKKLWWAKEITPDYYTVGRLSDRQIKYAKDAGVKSILSLWFYAAEGKFGEEPLPDTNTAERISTVAEMKFAVLFKRRTEWATQETVELLGTMLSSLPVPCLLHSDLGDDMTFLLLLHLAKQSRRDENIKPQVNSDKVYRMLAQMGYDFTSDEHRKLIADVTGEGIVDNPVARNVIPEMKNWNQYWHLYHVYKNYFTIGQFRRSHLSFIKSVGFKYIVNMRLGLTFNGKPTQEASTLINVKGQTYAFGEDGGRRQCDEYLAATRIDDEADSSIIEEGNNYSM